MGKILDVGWGFGKLLRAVKGNCEKYGVDISECLIEKARIQDLKSNYIVGDSNNLLYSSRIFDLVMCHLVIYHFEDSRKTISEILRVVKFNGSIFIRDLIRSHSEEVLQKLFLDYLMGVMMVRINYCLKIFLEVVLHLKGGEIIF